MAYKSNKDKIITIIKAIIPYRVGDITEDVDLICDLGFDSVNILRLINELEDNFQITFDENEFDLRNFNTPRSIVQLVERYKRG